MFGCPSAKYRYPPGANKAAIPAVQVGQPADRPPGGFRPRHANSRERRTVCWRELDSNLRFRARAGSILPVRFVADSLLEGDGFELLVPRHKSRGFPQHSGHLGVSAGLLNGSAFLLLRFEPLHRARLGHGLSRLWLAGLRGGFRLLAVKLRYTFARRSWLRRSTFSAGDSPSDPPASNWRVTRSRSVSSNSSRATVIKAPRRAPHRRHRRR